MTPPAGRGRSGSGSGNGQSGRSGRPPRLIRPGRFRAESGRAHVGPVRAPGAPGDTGAGSGSGRFAPRPLIAPGYGPEGERLRHDPSARSTVSPLKRLEDEEREQARRAETVRVGLRLSLMGVVVLGLFSIMVFRLWSLQVLNSSKAQDNVISLTTRKVPITPPRGLIEARGGQVLVSNKVESVVTLNRQVAANDPKVVQRLAVALGMSVGAVKSAINDVQDSVYEPAPIMVGAPESIVVYLSEHKSLFPGVTVSNVAERQYPDGDLLAQTLGYVGDISGPELKALKGKGYTAGDMIGQAGLEYQYERWLKGKTGVRDLLVDASGDPVGVKDTTPAKPGDDLVTNIDLGLQQAAEEDLAAQISARDHAGYPVHSGAVVVENPQNGAIYAMASYPTYSPSWWVGGMTTAHYDYLNSAAANQPLLNRAIQGEYAPGSTFKLASATAGLDTGLITPYSTYQDNGSFTIPNCQGAGCTYEDNVGDVPCGYCNVTTALTMSDDVFFYTLGYNFYVSQKTYGSDPIQQAAAGYAFGENPDIDLPDASWGQVDSPQLRVVQHKEAPQVFRYTYYGPGDAINTAFGQGETLITPLQLADAYGTFANGGTRYAPRIAAEIVSPSGKVVTSFAPKVLGHVTLSAANRQAIEAGLEGVTTATGPQGGTATSVLQQLHYPYSKLPIAGKTGTSQVSNNINAQPDSLFVAYGPVNNPQYVIAVVLPNAGYGADAAAPVVVRLFEYLIDHPVQALAAPTAQSGAG